MMHESWIKLYSRVFLLVGIANILANFAGFLFGTLLIIAAALLQIKQVRPIAAVLGPIAMAIAAFISIRTVVSILYPTPILYAPGVIYGSAAAFLMSPSPIFTLIAGGSAVIGGSYGEAMSLVDMVFNLVAVILNFLGLGFLVWGWPELVERQAGAVNLGDKVMTSVVPSG
jgi:hypothetical protein